MVCIQLNELYSSPDEKTETNSTQPKSGKGHHHLTFPLQMEMGCNENTNCQRFRSQLKVDDALN